MNGVWPEPQIFSPVAIGQRLGQPATTIATDQLYFEKKLAQHHKLIVRLNYRAEIRMHISFLLLNYTVEDIPTKSNFAISDTLEVNSLQISDNV
jgi:hypothetical protein